MRAISFLTSSSSLLSRILVAAVPSEMRTWILSKMSSGWSLSNTIVSSWLMRPSFSLS